MLKRAILCGLVLTAASGCDRKAASFEGVWVMITTPNTDPIEPDTSIDENFINASPGDTVQTDVDWTIDDITETSELYSFVQIIAGDTKDEAYLLIGSTIFPGTRGDGKQWTFARTFETIDESTETHESGYYYMVTSEEKMDVTIDVTIDKSDTKIMTGTVATSSDELDRWEESDEWADPADWPDSAIEGFPTPLPGSGQITSVSTPLLPEPVGNADANNYRDMADCQDSFCFVEIGSSWSQTTTVNFEKTDFEADNIVFPGEDFVE